MKNFYLILINSFSAGLSSSLIWFSLTIWVYLMTHSIFATSIISGCYMIAQLISGLIFGPLVDHHYKRSIMITGEILALIMLLLGLGIYQTTSPIDFIHPDSINLWIFILPIFLSVIIGNIRNVVLPTLTTIMVPKSLHDKANGLSGTITGMTYLIAPMLGGFLLSISGMFWALVIAIFIKIITITHLYSIKINEILARHKDQKISFNISATVQVVKNIPGLLALLIFNSINNFIGGVFGPLVDPYGLSLVNQKTWGIISGLLSVGFILGGWWIAKKGLGKRPLKILFVTNILMWIVCILFAILPSITLLVVGVFVYFVLTPFAEASEQTIIQKIVPKRYQGRVFGLGQSIESAATPLSTFAVGPIVQFIYIPFMSTGLGVKLIGSWFGTGEARAIALLFVTSGIIGLALTILSMSTKSYKILAASTIASR